MEILGIGTSELIFILLIAIIVLGPKEMQKAGKSVGRWLNQFVRSDGWKALQRASKEIRNLPTNLMREANLEELREMDQEIRETIDPRPPVLKTTRQQLPSNQPAAPSEPGSVNTDAQGEGSDSPEKQ
ncbi:MAG TPA: twin-arginine translocase TatA/TatE family subunit [Anaerolineales bacterium]|nr:twin-arginine translocase TatA/TatE family subunit [Anaerolineales bacterium]